MTEQNQDSKPLTSLARRARQLLGQGVYYFFSGFSLLSKQTEDTRHQLKEVFYSTSDQVLEKAEGTRKSVKLRMAILELEHHLNRLYPQIGKMTCDLSETGEKEWFGNEDLKTKMTLAGEYRQRLTEMKDELNRHHHRGPESDEEKKED